MRSHEILHLFTCALMYTQMNVSDEEQLCASVMELSLTLSHFVRTLDRLQRDHTEVQ